MKVKVVPSAGKLVSVVYDVHGLIFIDCLQKRKTINGNINQVEYYWDYIGNIKLTNYEC